jgi:hypothetical protein
LVIFFLGLFVVPGSSKKALEKQQKKEKLANIIATQGFKTTKNTHYLQRSRNR